ncbi:MAG: DUF5916 domain-containing protein, partial [Candidatus Aminicenantaceae bacterium]
TVAYIGYNSQNLYIGVRAFDSNPDAVRACLTKRDEVMGDDEISIYLDTFHDKKQAFVFQVNPCGVQSDGVYLENRRRRPGGGFSRIDSSWDTFFLTGAVMDHAGYSVEIQIPFKSLRFPHSLRQIWGLQIQRSIPRKNEDIYWAPRSRDVNGFLIQAGTLAIEGPLEKGRNLEIMPVITGKQSAAEKFKPKPGLNLKYGITSNLTADLTFNPDFSQIEADMPQVDVNQRYPLYYQEKRPFFLEGRDVFNTPIELIYTRSIVSPLWGGKLTGKTGKTTLGFLSAYDETPIYINIPIEEMESLQENTQGLVHIFRLKQDLYPESYIGFLLMDKETGAGWDSITQNHNRVGGVDGHFKFGGYSRFSFQVVGSHSRVADENTGLVPAMSFHLSRESRHWNLSAEYSHLPEDFEASLGFLRRKDIKSFQTRIGYNFLPQNDVIVDIRPSIEYRRAYDFQNNLTDEEIQIGGFISGWRGSFLFARFTTEMERYEGVDFYKNSFRAHLNSNPFSWLSGSLSFSIGDGIYYAEDPYLGYLVSYGFRATFKPLANLRMLYNYNNNTFYDERGGGQVYRINIISQRISYQLSRSISFRVITDYNDYYSDFFGSFLFSYEYRPGTVFYVGMNSSQIKDELGIFGEESQYYFIKFSYWWRI